jgi:hypothetical protein
MGAFVGGKLYPSWMHFFQALYCLHFSFIAFLSFLLQGLTKDTTLAWWPELTVLATGIFAEMIRLARDETPFPLAMQPKVTALAW